MRNQTGSIVLILLLFLAIVAAAGFYFVKTQFLDSPTSSELPTTTSQKTPVKLQTDYENPFESDTQYSNPFSDYQNPFNNLE